MSNATTVRPAAVPLIAPPAAEFDFLELSEGSTPAAPVALVNNEAFYTEPSTHRPMVYRCEPDMTLPNSYRISRIQRSYHLTEALTHGGSQPLYCEIPSGEIGIIQSVQREDGSGRCFNVTLQLWVSGEVVTRFVRFPKSVD